MKICIYVHSLSGGGAERVAAILATELSQRGHQITLLVDHDMKENQTYLGRHVKFAVISGHSHLGRLFTLVKYFAAVDYDVVHTITPALTLVTLLARALSRQKFRMVGAYHGIFGTTEGLLGRLSFLLSPILIHATDRTVCVSQWLKDYLEHRWHAKSERLVTIYNPVFVGTQSGDAPPTTAPEDCYILYVSRLVAAKDPLFAIDSFALLSEKHSHCKLVILGQGPYGTKMRLRGEELGVSDRLNFVGYIAQPWDFYRKAKAVIVTCKYESFSLVLVEAMAHGVPVIAVDGGGPREILDDGKYGTLVPADDTKAFASAIDAALDCPLSPAVLRARAAKFTVAVAGDAYEQLFEEVISEVR